MAHKLRLYYDSQLKYPVDIFDFGRIEVGESGHITFYVKNMSDKWNIVDIEATIPEDIKECKMVEIPNKLKPEHVGKCRYTCEPNIDVDDPLLFMTKITGRLEIG